MQNRQDISFSRNTVLLLLFILGFSSIISQVLILREFLFVFGGNELIIGIFLSIWMLITGIGAFTGKFINVYHIRFYRSLYVVLVSGFLPLLLLFIIDILRNVLFLPGIQISVFQIFASAFVLLVVYCFISGFLFSRFAIILKQAFDSKGYDKAYAAEAAGSMVGGIIFSFLLASFLDNFETSCVVALLTSAVVFWLGRRMVFFVSGLSTLCAALLFVFFFVFNGSSLTRSFLFPGQEIIETRDTRYGNLTVTQMADQLNFYHNNILLFTTHNQLSAEEAVHYAMAQHENPQKVMLISGGIAGLTNEILKYKEVQLIDYLEIDPEVFSLGKELTESLKSSIVNTYETDARQYLKGVAYKYDVVIMNLPEPSTLDLNRYFTIEFFRSVRQNLTEFGIFSFSLPSTANYLNDPAVKLNSSVYNTCKEIFPEVQIFPAGRNIYVASEHEISVEIGQLIDKKGIETDYVNLYYIDEYSMMQRAEYIHGELSTEERTNTDFKPVAIYGFIQYWLSQFQFNNKGFSITVLLVILALTGYLIFLKPAYPGIFAAGFTASSFQIIIVISFQIVIGHLYQSLGAIIAVFMAGLGLGALMRPRLIRICNLRNYAFLQLALTAFSCMIPAFILLSSNLSGLPVLVHVLFAIMVLGVSLLTGMIFSASLQLTGSKTKYSIAMIYGTDLAGAALGSLLTTIFIIPIMGIINAAFLFAFINLLAALNSISKRKTIDK